MYLSSYQKFINGQSNDYNELLMNYSQHFHNQGNLLEKDHDRVCVCVCGAGGGYELWGEVNSTYYKIIFSKILLFLFVLFPPPARTALFQINNISPE